MREQLRLPGIEERYLGVPLPAMLDPVIKYAGGKRWLLGHVLPRLCCHLANVSGMYVEPFCGGLAMGLGIGWKRSVFSDLNRDLINLYQALGIDPAQVSDVLDHLIAEGWSEDVYYQRRREVWPQDREKLSQFEWAARVLYLNKTCFNGLWRVNKKGEFNVPYGKYEQPSFPTREHLIRVGEVLGQSEIRCEDFGDVLQDVEDRGELDRTVFLFDPPYGEDLANTSTRGVVSRKTSGLFTGYTIEGFNWDDQQRLAVWAHRLAEKGSCVIVTNTWSESVCDLYRDGFDLFQVGVQHAIGATGARRGRRAELLAIDCAHSSIFEACKAELKR